MVNLDELKKIIRNRSPQIERPSVYSAHLHYYAKTLRKCKPLRSSDNFLSQDQTAFPAPPNNYELLLFTNGKLVNLPSSYLYYFVPHPIERQRRGSDKEARWS